MRPEIDGRDGSWPEMDCSRRWMTRDGSRPEMDRGMIWIATGHGWMTEVDDWRWITGDGSRKTDDNQSPFLYEATKLQSSANLKTYGVPAAWLHRVRCQALLSTIRNTIQRYRIMQLHARVTMPNTNPNLIPSRTAPMPIPHIMKPYEISLWRSNGL